MITKIIEKGIESKSKFPKLARYKKSNFIVLFTNEKSGAVIYPGSDVWEVGYYDEHWVPCIDANYWEILSEVTINFKM